MDRKIVIATVINDVINDQRMIRICTSLSKKYKVSLWGRKRVDKPTTDRPYDQLRIQCIVNNGVLFYAEYNIRLFFKLLFTRFDILHGVDLDTLPATYLAARLKGKKIIYDAHEYFTEVPEVIHRPKVQKVWKWIERSLVPRVDEAITVGPMIANEFADHYNKTFTVVRNCPNILPVKPNSGKGEYLIYQGALNKGRGLEETIKAMHKIDLPLYIAGSGDLDFELRAQVKAEGLENKVTFLGLLPPDELLGYTVNAFAGINVSENLGLSYYYSLNNKYFDYIQAGIPAVTNPFPEYLALNQIFECCEFTDANSESIADAVNLLLNNPDRYEELKKNCLIARQNLTWSNEEEALFRVYSHV